MASSLNQAQHTAEYTYNLVYTLRWNVMDRGLGAGLLMNAFFCCISATAVFSHLYFPKSASGFAALPVRREGLFSSAALAGLLPLLLVHLFVFLLTAIVEAAYGALYLPSLLTWLAIVCMQCLFFFGFAAFCAQLTGNIIVLPLVYLLLNVLSVSVEFLVRKIFSFFVYGYQPADYLFEFLSPAFAMGTNCGIKSIMQYSEELELSVAVDYQLTGWNWLVVYACIGLVLLGGAMWLYKKRRMETAGDVVALRCLKPVFKYCMTAGCGICLALLLFSILFGSSRATTPMYAVIFSFFMLAGCIVGYFFAEMLLLKTFHVFRGMKRWLGIGVSFALLTVLLFSFEFDLWGYERKVPEADEVKAVYLYDYSYGMDYVQMDEPDNIAALLALHADIIAHKEQHEAGNQYVFMRLKYLLQDGSTIERAYSLDALRDAAPGDAMALQTLLNSQEAIEGRKTLNYPVTAENILYSNINYEYLDETGKVAYETLNLTPQDAYELYAECILPDLKEGKLGRVWLMTDDDYLDTVFACTIDITCHERSRDGVDNYQNFMTTATTTGARTRAWLEEHGVILMTQREMGEIPDYDRYILGIVPTGGRYASTSEYDKEYGTDYAITRAEAVISAG